MSSHDIYYITVTDTTGFESKTIAIGDDILGVLRHIFGTTRVDKLGDNVVTIQSGMHGPIDVNKLQIARDAIPGVVITTTPPIDTGVQLVDIDDDSLASIDYKIDDRLIYLHIESKDPSPEMQRFFVDFLGRSRQSEESGEIVVLGRSGTSVCGFYGVLPPSGGDINKEKLLHRIRARLQKRKLLAMEDVKHLSIREKYLTDHNIIRTTVLKDYNTFLSKAGECVLTSAQGISLEKILQCLRSNNPNYTEPSIIAAAVSAAPSLRTARSASTRKTAEEVDADVRAKSVEIVERINHFLSIEEQVRTKFKLDGDTINELVAKRVFMTSERAFVRSNRHLIQSMIEQQISQFKESEPVEAKAKRLKTVEDERRALAQSYVQKIKEYCDERVDEHGFCNLKNVYTYKILAKLVGDDIITARESVEAESVQYEIDELLEDARTKNAQRNKGDLAKAKQLARRLLEIFLFEFERFDDDEFGNFISDPREYVYRNVYDSNYDFGATDRALFGGVHHDMIISTVRAEYEKVKQAGQMFVDAEKLRRSAEVEDTERETFEALQRIRREANDDIMSVLPSLEALQTSENGGWFGGFLGNSFKEKYKQYKRDPSGFTPEQIAVFKEEERLAPIRKRLYEKYNAQTVEELKARIRPLEEYVRDLEPFEPTAEEVREYIRTNFTTICEN